MSKLTPMMEQYMEIKNKYEDCIMLFRLGDFYEIFFADAELAARELEITLTGRECGLENKAPMCGVPYHAADTYIDKLVSKGYKVAICEQIENPSEAKGIVKRDVIRVITPGTLIDTGLLDDKKNNYLISLYMTPVGYGLSHVDISTGEFFATEIKNGDINQKLIDEISKIEPNEIIYFEDDCKETKAILEKLGKRFNIYISEFEPYILEKEYCIEQIKEQLSMNSIEDIGFNSEHLGIYSTGSLIHYLKSTQKRSLTHINNISIYTSLDKMTIDLATRKNLELVETIRGKSKKGSLLWILDRTLTAMGGRLIRKWIEEPLLDVNSINERLAAVEVFKDDMLVRHELKDSLRQIYDLERLSGKIAFGSVNPRDLIALKKSLSFVPGIKSLLETKNNILLNKLLKNIDLLEDVQELIDKAILDESPISIKDGGIIKEGYNADLDELNGASRDGKHWIAKIEQQERENTGIKSLKIGYNRIFGYYIEITKSNLHLAPDSYMRKQTLANCERYITPELKEIESKILGAEEKSVVIEYNLFMEIRNILLSKIERIQRTARAIAELDSLYSLSEAASEYNYVKPIINDTEVIEIHDGRHPVVERVLENNLFIANDTLLNTNDEQLIMITGPNMAGKSTYMRQVALIVLMAQIGSFVPASSATIGIADRIFTRVGANDDLSQGQSTFMVEMSEMANIINSATKRSLLIVDEIGRGTSTFDGMSIAWSTAEYICKHIQARTLFSTHYHELTELSDMYKAIKNYKVSVKEDKDTIIFLHKVIKGSADKSYGIQVARLAGLPIEVISRADEILLQLETKNGNNDNNNITISESRSIKEEYDIVPITVVPEQKQLKLEDIMDNAVIKELKELNLLETTPIDSLNILYKLQKKAMEL